MNCRRFSVSSYPLAGSEFAFAGRLLGLLQSTGWNRAKSGAESSSKNSQAPFEDARVG